MFRSLLFKQQQEFWREICTYQQVEKINMEGYNNLLSNSNLIDKSALLPAYIQQWYFVVYHFVKDQMAPWNTVLIIHCYIVLSPQDPSPGIRSTLLVVRYFHLPQALDGIPPGELLSPLIVQLFQVCCKYLYLYITCDWEDQLAGT